MYFNVCMIDTLMVINRISSGFILQKSKTLKNKKNNDATLETSTFSAATFHSCLGFFGFSVFCPCIRCPVTMSPKAHNVGTRFLFACDILTYLSTESSKNQHEIIWSCLKGRRRSRAFGNHNGGLDFVRRLRFGSGLGSVAAIRWTPRQWGRRATADLSSTADLLWGVASWFLPPICQQRDLYIKFDESYFHFDFWPKGR